MADYQDIRGLRVKYLSADPSNTVGGQVWYNSTTGALKTVVKTEAWSTGTPLANARFAGSGCGIQESALAFAGWGGPAPASASQTWTEEYDGTGWAAGGNMNNNRHYMCGMGATATAGLAGGGEPVPFIQKTEEYNGTAWTEVNTNPTPFKYQFTGTGIQTAALSIMGYQQPTGTVTNACFEYDGTNWTAGGSGNTARMSGGGAGTQTATIAMGGNQPPANAAMGDAEEYNGTGWTTITSATAQAKVTAGFGSSTSAYIAGGATGPTGAVLSGAVQEWDGSSWNTKTSLATARYFGAGATSGTATAGLVAGGYTTTWVADTEEWNVGTTVITPGAWASGGTLNTARQSAGGFGNARTAAVAAGGGTAPPASALDKSEEYDGTSWTEGNAINTARLNLSGFGVLTAGVVAGVGTPSITYGGTTELYNGTSWTTGNPYAAPGAAYRPGCGLATTGLLAGGVSPSPAEFTTAVEEFDGTNWTAGGVLPQFQAYQNMAGTQTAAINGGGISGPAAPGPVSSNAISLEYNGTGWTAGPSGNLYSDNTNSWNGGSGTQTAAMFVGGDGVGTTLYDGTSFTTAPAVAAARGNTCAAGQAPSATATIFTGSPVPTIGNTTEEFTGQTTSGNIETLTTS